MSVLTFPPMTSFTVWKPLLLLLALADWLFEGPALEAATEASFEVLRFFERGTTVAILLL